MAIENFTDTPTERALLACLCQHGYDAMADIEGIVFPTTFSVFTNQVIFKSLNKIWKDDTEAKVDIPLLIAYANGIGCGDYFQPVKEREYLEKLLLFPVNKESAKKYGVILRRKEVLGMIYNKLEEQQQIILDSNGDIPLDECIANLEGELLGLANILDTDDSEKIGSDIDEHLKYLEENPVDVLGIPTGHKRLDELTGGMLQPATITVITARTGEGKSYWAIDIGSNVAGKYNIPVLNLDTELQKSDQQNRLLAKLSGVDILRIKKGKFAQNKYEKMKVVAAAKIIKEMPFEFKSISGRPTHEIMAIMRRWLFKNIEFDAEGKAGQCLIIYDYLKLMNNSDVNKNMSETQVFGQIMSALHDFALKYGISILTFVQANRESLSNEESAVIAQSDRIAWYASTILHWLPKNEKDEELTGEYGNYKLRLLKTRLGPGLRHPDYINYTFDGSISLIKEGKLYSEIRSEIKRKMKEQEEEEADE